MTFRSSFLGVFFWAFLLRFTAAQSSVIINEVHCSRRQVEVRDEFVELYHAGNQSLDLSGWRLEGGVRFVFPEGTRLEPGRFLLIGEDGATLLRLYGGQTGVAQGSYEGKLGAGGEALFLYNAQSQLIDALRYDRGFPWPTVGGSLGHSLQLMHPSLDNDRPGHWRSAAPTPGRANEGVLLADGNAPPLVDKVRHLPRQPRSGESVRITARIDDPDGIEDAQVLIQVVEPGSYIRLADANYEKIPYWRVFTMNDEGKDGDERAGDGIFSASIPDSVQRHRRLIRYRIWVRDRTEHSLRLPYADDPQPNFAYFVYDSLPDYAGYKLSALPQLPVCHLIAQHSDVDYLINQYRGNNYKQTGTIVYNGEVYDHVTFRSRGFANRHARPKRNLKFNFTRGHDVEVRSDEGDNYKVKRSKMALSGTWLLEKPNTHGLAESVLYRFFTMQGTPASYADYLHLRVVSRINERDTFGGDFWGIYLALENYDGDFLKTHRLPDGNIYSYKPFKQRHAGEDGPFGARNPAYLEWDSLHKMRNTPAWWESHLDIQAFLGFVIGNQAINNRETGYRGQHWWSEYMNPHTGHWYVFPWDLDLTWTKHTGYGTIASAIRNPLLAHPEMQIRYENQLRGFLDLLYNEEQAFRLIDQEASYIYNPSAPYSWTHLDKIRWRHSYTDYKQEIEALKQFVVRRRAHILESILPAATLPKPKAEYVGKEGFPVDALRFRCADAPLAAVKSVQWRIAEVDDPSSNPHYQNKKRRLYEIEALWYEDRRDPTAEISLPEGLVLPGRSYRVRVRTVDAQGRCSHWSEPLQFVAGKPTSKYPEGLIFNELLYAVGGQCKVEFVELYHAGTQDLDLSGVQIKGGIRYRFPQGSRLAAGGFLVLTNDSLGFIRQYGYAAQGVFQGSLNKKGERIRLVDHYGEVLDSLHFDNKAPWDEGAASGEFSLELLSYDSERHLPQSWKASKCACGTPGGINRAEAPPSAVLQKPGTRYRFLFYLCGGVLLLGLLWFAFKRRVKAMA